MMLRNIFTCILVSSLYFSPAVSASAQQVTDSVLAETVQMDTTHRAVRKAFPPKWLSGMSISFDVLGAVLTHATSYGSYEAALRVNLRQKYFPTLEAGIGICKRDNATTGTHFETKAPYFRLGADVNLARDKQSGNRIFIGLRYGISSFKFDYIGTPVQDPVWSQSLPLSFTNQSSTAHWGEFVFGLETKIWKNLHLGWSARYRKRITQQAPAFGQPWYIPGYGKNAGHTFGGTFNLIFDL